MEKALLSELLEGLAAVHSFLAKDIAKDKLSSKNHKARNYYIHQLDQLIQKVRASSAEPAPPTIIEPPPPTIQNRPPSKLKPPISAPPPEPDEGGDVYEIPDQVQDKPPQEQPSEYTSFLPVTLDDEEPQEEYLAMEAEHREEIDEEMYEDPSAVNPEPELYEDPQPAPPIIQAPVSNSNYMEPVKVSDKRKSMVPEELINDWDCVYDQSQVNKKKEKVKVSKLNNVQIKGWLEKLGGRSHKNWQKRYCVLSEMFMYFYEKEGSSSYNNRIPIPGFVPNPSAELTQPKKNHFVFKLSSTDSIGVAKDYYFRAKTETERDQWVACIRKIFEQGRSIIEKRKSMTLPNSFSSGGLSIGKPPVLPPMGELEIEDEQEEYECLGPGLLPEDDQEEYMDVTANNPVGGNGSSQEEYMDVQGGARHDLDEPQEDYVEPEEFRQALSRQTTSNSSFAPPPSGSATKMPLPPPPPSNDSNPPSTSVTNQPLPALPPIVKRQSVPATPPANKQDPVVNTEKVYTQSQDGVPYNKVYVILWDFEGVDNDEIKVKRGDLVHVLKPDKGHEWWFGELVSQDCSRKTGPTGLFPANYCSVAFEVA